MADAKSQLEITTEEIKARGSDGADMIGFLARPQVEGQHPGLIVIHEVFGLTDQIRGVARRYAAEGFVALAPNLYTREGDLLTEQSIRRVMSRERLFSIPFDKREDPAAVENMMKGATETDRRVIDFFLSGGNKRILTSERMCNDLLSYTDHLKGLHSVNPKKLGITGFCLGGSLSYQLATMYPYVAVVPFYGWSPIPLESVAKIEGEVFGVYGGEDETYNSSIPQLAAAMVKHKKTFQFKVYKGARHGFFNEMGVGYDKEASEDAWKHSLAFFNKHLRA